MRDALMLLSACALMAACTTTTNLAGVPEQRPATKAPPESRARVHTELAALYYQQGSYKTALSEIDTAIRVDPGYAPAYGVRGLIDMQLAENTRAADDFRQAIALAPNDPDIRNNYGLFLCETGQPAAGLKQLEQAWTNPLYDTPGRALANASRCAAGTDPDLAETYRRRAALYGTVVDVSAAPSTANLPKTP
jgi:type IV pilus assembly protein PilF